MKRNISAFPSGVLILGLLFITTLPACKQNSPQKEQDTAQLKLTITMEETYRTILGDTSLTPSYAEITGSGPGSTSFTVSPEAAGGEASCTVDDLIPGSWEITTQIFNDTDILIGYGNETVTLEEGTSEHTLTALPLEGEGTLNIDFSWDPLWVQDPSIEAELLPQDGSTALPLTCTTEEGSASGTLTAEAGFYTLTVQLYDGTASVAGAAEAVLILPDHTSSGTIDLTVDQEPLSQTFTIESSLYKAAAVTIQAPDHRIYAGESCQFTVLTGESALPQWYLDGSALGTGETITLSAECGNHRMDVLCFESDNLTGGSDSYSFSVHENIQYGNIRYTSSVTDGEDGTDGLRGVRKVAISPDGTLLAASGYDENKLALFSPDPETGTLDYLEAKSAVGAASCDQIKDLAFSSDGKTLFSASAADSAVHILRWNPLSKNLTFLDSIPLPGAPSAISLTADDRFLVVASESPAEIELFAIDCSQGTYALKQTINGTDLPGGILSPPDSTGFNSLSDTLGVGSFSGDVLYLFHFDSSSGFLTHSRSFTDGDGTAELLNGISSFAFSPEGENLYAVSYYDNGISCLTREAATETWNLQKTWESIDGSYPGFSGLKDIGISGDGTELYICAQTGDSLIVFSRETGSGDLSYEGSWTRDENNITVLNGIRSLTLNTLNGDVYTAASNSNGVAHFSRMQG